MITKDLSIGMVGFVCGASISLAGYVFLVPAAGKVENTVLRSIVAAVPVVHRNVTLQDLDTDPNEIESLRVGIYREKLLGLRRFPNSPDLNAIIWGVYHKKVTLEEIGTSVEELEALRVAGMRWVADKFLKDLRKEPTELRLECFKYAVDKAKYDPNVMKFVLGISPAN